MFSMSATQRFAHSGNTAKESIGGTRIFIAL
jgi:hypothetical protein